MNPDPTPLALKVYYRPIEAAIRWCGLDRHEQSITTTMLGKMLPAAEDFPQWPSLRLNAERLFDAIANRELPFGIDGVTVHSGFRLDHPSLTVRHVDLRSWMIRYYPHERPAFLFDPAQSTELPPSTVKSVIRERDELRASLTEREEQLWQLRNRNGTSQPSTAHIPRSEVASLTLRAEATYLHIIGVMLRLLLDQSRIGPHSTFATQESVVSAMVDQFGKELMGITERTLHAKFAAANRKLEGR